MRARLLLPSLLLVAAAAAAEPPRPQVDPVAIPTPTPTMKIKRLPPVAPSVAVPNGSYLATCQNVRIEGALLHASCEARTGVRVDSSIDVAGCAGVDIFNRHGLLMCVTPVRARWGGRVLPPGSYVDSCKGEVQGTTLVGLCKTGKSDILGNTDYRVTKVDLARCPDGSEIANLRGDLTCIAR